MYQESSSLSRSGSDSTNTNSSQELGSFVDAVSSADIPSLQSIFSLFNDKNFNKLLQPPYSSATAYGFLNLLKAWDKHFYAQLERVRIDPLAKVFKEVQINWDKEYDEKQMYCYNKMESLALALYRGVASGNRDHQVLIDVCSSFVDWCKDNEAGMTKEKTLALQALLFIQNLNSVIVNLKRIFDGVFSDSSNQTMPQIFLSRDKLNTESRVLYDATLKTLNDLPEQYAKISLLLMNYLNGQDAAESDSATVILCDEVQHLMQMSGLLLQQAAVAVNYQSKLDTLAEEKKLALEDKDKQLKLLNDNLQVEDGKRKQAEENKDDAVIAKADAERRLKLEKKKLGEANKTITDLRAELDQANLNTEAAEARITALEETAKKNQALASKIQELESRVAELEQENKQLDNKVKEHPLDLQAVRMQNKADETELAELRKLRDEKINEIFTLKAENAFQGTNIKDLLAEKGRLSERVKGLEQNQQQSAINTMQEELSRLYDEQAKLLAAAREMVCLLIDERIADIEGLIPVKSKDTKEKINSLNALKVEFSAAGTWQTFHDCLEAWKNNKFSNSTDDKNCTNNDVLQRQRSITSKLVGIFKGDPSHTQSSKMVNNIADGLDRASKAKATEACVATNDTDRAEQQSDRRSDQAGNSGRTGNTSRNVNL